MEADVASASGRGALRDLTARPPAALRDALGALLTVAPARVGCGRHGVRRTRRAPTRGCRTWARSRTRWPRRCPGGTRALHRSSPSHGYVREDLTGRSSRCIRCWRGSPGGSPDRSLLGGALVSLVAFLVGLVVVAQADRARARSRGGAADRVPARVLPGGAVLLCLLYRGAVPRPDGRGAVPGADRALGRRVRSGGARLGHAQHRCARGGADRALLPVRPARRPAAGARAGMAPALPVGRELLWLALVPLGLVAYSLYQWDRFDDPLATWHVQTFWSRGFHGPFSAVWYAIRQDLAGHATSCSRAVTTPSSPRPRSWRCSAPSSSPPPRSSVCSGGCPWPTAPTRSSRSRRRCPPRGRRTR